MKKSGNTKKLSNTLGTGKLLILELLTRIELVTSTLPIINIILRGFAYLCGIPYFVVFFNVQHSLTRPDSSYCYLSLV